MEITEKNRRADIPTSPTRASVRISVLYVVVGTIWIVASDQALDLIPLDPVMYARIETLKGWFFVGITGIILFLFVRGVMRRQSRLAEQIVSIEKKHNEEITANLAEKELLLREIHHRVRNNLQVISSLLSLEESVTSDPSAARHLANSRGRVRAMSLVHEVLYQSEGLGSVRLRGYIERLVNHLLDFYGRSVASVDIRISVSDLEVDLKLAVPFGLLINELLMGAFQSARAQRSTPGPIVLSVTGHDDQLRLELTRRVREEGANGNREPAGSAESNAMARRIIDSLVRQLGGHGGFTGNDDETFSVTIPYPSRPTESAATKTEDR